MQNSILIQENLDTLTELSTFIRKKNIIKDETMISIIIEKTIYN